MFSENALKEAMLEYCSYCRKYAELVAEEDPDLGDAAGTILAEMIAVSGTKFESLDDDVKLAAFTDVHMRYATCGVFVPEGTFPLGDMLESTCDAMVTLMLGEVELMGTPQEEMDKEYERLWTEVQEILDAEENV